MKPIVLITGATAGIGRACAEKFASEGYRLILTGRRTDRLEEIKKDIITRFSSEIHCISLDVQDRIQVFKALESIPEPFKQVDILINNAGLALGRESFESASMDDWETMMQTNVNGLLYVSRAIIPTMIARNKGHIINLGSIAGKEVYENGNVYCASKFAVDAISKSMRIDLLKYGIKVTSVNPGATDTEFSLVRYKGDSEKAAMAYEGYTPLKAEDIADTIYYCAQLPDHVCINDLVITCLQQAGSYYFNKE